MSPATNFLSRSRRRRYSPEERDSLVLQVHHMRTNGMKMAAIVNELGVTGVTLAKWMKESRPSSAFLPVQVIPARLDSAALALTLVTPAGYRVEGLTPDTVVALLRQLG